MFKIYMLVVAFGYNFYCPTTTKQSLKDKCQAEMPTVVFYKSQEEAAKDYQNMPGSTDKARLYEIEIDNKLCLPEVSIREVQVKQKQQYEIVVSTRGVYLWP